MPIPLDTLGPTIDATGISAPSFQDILDTLKYQYRALYGQDVNIDDDTQDGQFIGIQAKAINDSNNAIVSSFNARSPSSAQGAGLSSVVKINGLKREVSSNSTAPVTITGVAGTSLENCLIGDNQGLGTQWSIPNFTIIGDGGTVDVSATCTTPGAITAEIDTLTAILTPTLGWQSVTNSATAFPGTPVEDDATLRQRQAVSQNQAAQSPADATLAAILNLPGVARATYYENVGSGTDSNGVPGHSISYVVGGGDIDQIAQTIAQKKTIGTGTYGTTTVNVVDPSGNPIPINFFVLDLTTVTVAITIQALFGYSSTTADAIKAAVSNYISTLPIGGIVHFGKVNAIAALMGSPLNSTFDVVDADTLLNGVSADVIIDFNKAAVTLVTDVSVTVGP